MPETAPDNLRIPAAGALFAGDAYRILCGPLVLMFLTQGRIIYIGWSKAGLGFCTGQRRYPVRNCEEVLVFPCSTYEEARALHASLVEQHNPKHNTTVEKFRVRALPRLAEAYRGAHEVD